MNTNTRVQGSPVIDMADPYPAYRQLQEDFPVFQTQNGQWIVSRYKDASDLLKDPRCRHWGQDRGMVQRLPSIERSIASTLYTLSPENNLPFRKAILHRLAARSLRIEEDTMHQLACDLLDQLRGRTEIDFVRDFAHPFTFGTIGRIIGISGNEAQELANLVSSMDGGYLSCIDPNSRRLSSKGRLFTKFIQGLIHSKVVTPDEGLCSVLLSLRKEQAFEDDFLISLIILLLYAGHQNMMNFLGNAVLAIKSHPLILQYFKNCPAELAKHIDELIRYDSPLQYIMLITQHEVTVTDEVIPSNSQVLVGVGAANRDPAEFDYPDSILIGRRPNHLGFGTGSFRCIGARLAQIQGFTALKAWMERVVEYHPVEEKIKWRNHPFVQRGPAILPLQMIWNE